MTKSVPDPASLDVFSAAFLLPNVGAPFVVGLAVGYFAKKVFKIALFVGGAAVVLIFIAEYYGIARVDEQALHQSAQTAVDVASQSGNFLYDRLSHLSWKGGSAAVGFLAGLKLG